jgi:1-acyl-sn-glycerol-3-phosphate acyltransferase
MSESTPIESTESAQPAVWGPRAVLNRFLFRAMLFSMGAIAVAMYRLSRNKNMTWRFAKAQARNLSRVCGVRVHVRGLEHLGHGPRGDEPLSGEPLSGGPRGGGPRGGGPYMFTPNHQSHFDIAALLGYLPGENRFAAKMELFRQPVLGMVLRTLGMIPIDRSNPLEAIDKLNRLKEEHYSTIIFPEGTRSRDGNLLPFKKGPFVAAIHLGIPIVPVVCKGTAEIMPKGGYLSIVPGEVEIVVLEPIATAGMSYDDRDRLRDEVRERIAAELKS